MVGSKACRENSAWRQATCCFFLSVCALSQREAFAQATSNTLPAPTGEAACGRATFQWTDVKRAETWTETPDDKRELLVTLWYPATIDPATKASPYYPQVEKLPDPKGFERGLAKRLVGHAFDEAPLRATETPYPVLIFSPGAGAPPYYYATLLEDLATHGFVIAAIDHSYEGVGQVLLDGRTFSADVEKRRPEPAAGGTAQDISNYYRQRVDVRAADAVTVLGELQKLNQADSRFAGRLDLQNVGVFGHSLGGLSATQACASEPRFKSAANLDGVSQSRPLYLADQGGGMKQPLLFLAKPVRRPTVEEFAKQGISEEKGREIFEDMQRRIPQALATIQGGAWYVVIPGAKHISFSDSVYFLPTDAAEKDRIISVTRQFLRDFFDATLRGRPGKLLAAGAPARDDVVVERFPAH